MTVAELVAELSRLGFGVPGRPSKTVSDALRWEVRRGRVYPRGRGIYGPGEIPRGTEHRIEKRVEALREQARILSGQSAPASPGPVAGALVQARSAGPLPRR